MELKAVRDGWGEGLIELGERNPKVIVLTADLKESTQVEEFAKRFPERFIECGVAEQNMMGIAAGLAAAGKIPFVSSYSVFSPGRNWDQLRVSVCFSNLHVVIGGHHTGLSAGPDGATHQALEDIAMTRVLPNMKVIVPADAGQAKEMTILAAEMEGAVYIRLTKGKTAEVNEQCTMYNVQFEEQRLTPAAVIIGCGPILNEALQAVQSLQAEGIAVKLINGFMVKPLDNKTILDAVKECGAVVTVEDHQIAGGMGSAVAELLARNYPVPIEFVGVKDSFGESGTPEELAIKYGLRSSNIIDAVRRVLTRKF